MVFDARFCSWVCSWCSCSVEMELKERKRTREGWFCVAGRSREAGTCTCEVAEGEWVPGPGKVFRKEAPPLFTPPPRSALKRARSAPSGCFDGCQRFERLD